MRDERIVGMTYDLMNSCKEDVTNSLEFKEGVWEYCQSLAERIIEGGDMEGFETLADSRSDDTVSIDREDGCSLNGRRLILYNDQDMELLEIWDLFKVVKILEYNV